MINQNEQIALRWYARRSGHRTHLTTGASARTVKCFSFKIRDNYVKINFLTEGGERRGLIRRTAILQKPAQHLCKTPKKSDMLHAT